MAQVSKVGWMGRKETTAAVTVDTTPDVVLTLVHEGQANELLVWVSNGTAQAMNACSLEIQAKDGGAWFELNAAWSAAGAVLQYFSTNLAVLNNTAGVAWVKLPPCHAVRLKAGVAASTAAISASFDYRMVG